MPTKQEYRERLVEKLKELFQLDQPDLDFGFYRIMHSKAEQVTQFLERDLLAIIEDAFGEQDEAIFAQLQANVEKAIQTARRFGAPDPEETEGVQEARAALAAAQENAGAEASVYDHLYRFFERYYDRGDFISRRYYSRETGGKAAPFAVPYNGEEVKLHWANADQYYIKTAEYFNNATFDLSQAPEVAGVQLGLGMETGGENDGETAPAMRLHFHIVEATEGAHGNVKASEQETRYFIIHHEEPVTLNEAGELVIQFEYRPDPEKTGQEGTWRSKRADEAVTAVLAALKGLAGGEAYLTLLTTPAPTEKDAKRPLLARYVNQYTGRNTHDYFIHKDLGGFLGRELDFYIKNEVMRLDDIEQADAPAVESYLGKIKVLRRIGGEIITFLAQLEEFQKKLWLKKKFVVEAQYCLTLDRVPEAFYAEIAANDAQREAWVGLYAINEIQLSTIGPAYSVPLTVEFLGANPYMMVDTTFFGEEFKARLLATVEDLDEQCDGMLVYSENFQALNLMQERYREQAKCIYIDPPYNTASTPILYKNEYRHSSWNCLMWDRLKIAKYLLEERGVKSVAIDDTEMLNLAMILEDLYPEFRHSRITVVHNPKGSITKDFNRVHEYALFMTKEADKSAIARTLEENETPRKMRRWGANSLRTERPLSFYPIYVRNGEVTRIGDVPSEDFHPGGRNTELASGEIEIWPVDQDGIERRWNFGLDTIKENLDRVTTLEVDGTVDLFVTHELTVPKTVWSGGEFDAGNYGNTLLVNLLGTKQFDFPKSINLVTRCIYLSTATNENGLVIDYFGGSGTTSHAVIEQNRRDGGHRKYVLVEMGTHFYTVLKPRVQKVVYSTDWKDGKPQSRGTGLSHCFKTLRLESYEDTLNNLVMADDPGRQQALDGNDDLRRDYMLRYLLDVESRGSQSLLNIDGFADPTAYTLKVKKPGSDEYTVRKVDLVESFNYLIGLRVVHVTAPQTFNADFKRVVDPELPADQETRLVLDGRMRQEESGPWWFRTVEGWVPANPMQPNNGLRERVLVVWRKLTGDVEQDNLMLDEWFRHNRISPQDFEFDTIYVNGSNNLPNLRQEGETWKVRLLEEAFMQAMWDGGQL